MSLKNLFENTSYTIVSSGTIDQMSQEVESKDYIRSYLKERDKFRSHIDFSKPQNFVKFGSAEKYFIDTIERIYNTYPYDGSYTEKINWQLSSSDIDIHFFNNEYPRTNGYATISATGWGERVGSQVNSFGLPDTIEYIQIKGGPHLSTRAKDKDIEDTSGKYTSGYSNVYDPAKNRASNLAANFDNGVTIEFWMKKAAGVEGIPWPESNREVLFHLWNGEVSSEKYGSILLSTWYTNASAPHLHVQSGSISNYFVMYESGVERCGPPLI